MVLSFHCLIRFLINKVSVRMGHACAYTGYHNAIFINSKAIALQLYGYV